MSGFNLPPICDVRDPWERFIEAKAHERWNLTKCTCYVMKTQTDKQTASAQPENVRTYPTITLTLPKPIGGFWDGGARSRFTFEATECDDGKGTFLKWGSWEMNFWRTTDGIGRSPKDAAGRMVRWMRRNIRHEGATITVNP